MCHFFISAIVKNLTKAVRIELIVGSHPHITQKHWYSGKTLVAASLGNLYFGPYNYANNVSIIDVFFKKKRRIGVSAQILKQFPLLEG